MNDKKSQEEIKILEEYLPNQMREEEIEKVKDIQICFCSFKLQNTQGIEHKIVSKILVDKLRDMGYFFMRKVTGNTRVYSNYFIDILAN